MSDKTQSQSIKDILLNGLRYNIKQYSMFIALLGIFAFFTILTQGTFLTPRNLSNLLMQTSYIAILAIGMVLVIVAGHIDLSVGFLAGLCGAIAAYLQVYLGWGTLPAILMALLAGVIIGIWQGYWVAFQGVPAFIVTLAGMMIFKGLLIVVTGGQTIAPLHDDFRAIGQDYLPQLFLKGEVGPEVPFHDFSLTLAVLAIALYIFFELRDRASRIKYGFNVLPVSLLIGKIILVTVMIGAAFSIMIFYYGIPYAILLLLLLVLLFSFVTNKTVFGRHVYAIGGNKEAAKLSGINIRSRTMTIFIIMGLLSAVSGIVFTARLNSATASGGTLFELDAIAAAIIGGTSTMGGEGTIVGAMIGALVMAALNNGMSLMNVDPALQFIFKGLILLLAVWFDIASRQKKG